MSEDIADRGKKYSSTEVKDNMGRSSFLRTKHEGNASNPTEWTASKRLAHGSKPTDTEKKLTFEDNPNEVKAFRSAGMSDDEIYKILSNR